MQDKPTPLTEMAEFFPVTTRQQQPTTVVAVTICDGETYETALARHQLRKERIQAMIKAKEQQA